VPAYVAVSATDEEIRALARRILDGPEYAEWRPSRWFADVMQWLAALADRSPALYWTLVAGLLLVTIALFVHVLWTVRVALRAAGTRPPESSAVSPRRFSQEAEALAAAGHFLEAARRLQLAVLDLLLRVRVLELGRSDANCELRARLRRAPLPDTERTELLALIDRFERAWFRDRDEDPALYTAWRTLHDRLGGMLRPA